MRYLFLGLLLGMMLVLAIQGPMVANAETVLWGPADYTTNQAGHSPPWQSFTAPEPGEGILRLEKATPDKKIQAGHIRLNDEQFALTTFLRGENTTIDIPVQLAKNNSFMIVLGGKKEAHLRLTIVGNYGPEINFYAQPVTIHEGESATLFWSSQDADTVTISPELGSASLNDSVTVRPARTTTYTLLASNSNGSSEAKVVVTVLPKPPGITFSADPAEITKNESSTLSWQVENADSITIDNGIGSVDAVGSTFVSPTASSTYTITAINAGGTSHSSVTVAVVPLKVTILEPANLATIPGNVSVHGRLDTEATYINASVNGERAVVQGKEFFINKLGLPAGDNEITVQAADPNGNQATAVIEVFVEETEPEIALAIDDPIGMAPFRTVLKATLNFGEIAADSAIVFCDGSGEVENIKKSDTEFALTFTTPGLYTLTYTVTDSAGSNHAAQVRVAVKAAFTQDDMLDMQADVKSLENIYSSQLGNMDIETVRQQILAAARANPDFSSVALSSGALCLVYKDLIPIILDLPDPNGPATDGSSASRKPKEIKVLK
ncbi:MAG: PKD domain-containing protein [Proteobacteria bacterium]|nr:PKD domain-containing protein [Pseudomonadota bacterium]MBU4295879.1 PKD domain-containing protein [Pseudomonadota bacterium]MCG2748400.1 PKD domain-containing protein [Desulfobulbaceae bacterium]